MKISTAFLVAAAMMAPSHVNAAALEWRDEPQMNGTQYRGWSPPGQDLVIKDWRNDGGSSISDDLHGIGFYSTPDRMGVSAQMMQGRDAGGIPSWTITSFMSVPLTRNEAFFNVNCGVGKDFQQGGETTEQIIGVVPAKLDDVEAEFVNTLLAAAKIDLKTGTITPIKVDGSIYCMMELP